MRRARSSVASSARIASAPQSSAMKANRSAGYAGSSGTYADPAASVPRMAAIMCGPCGSSSAVTRPGTAFATPPAAAARSL
jgi:hypothetical protein